MVELNSMMVSLPTIPTLLNFLMPPKKDAPPFLEIAKYPPPFDGWGTHTRFVVVVDRLFLRTSTMTFHGEMPQSFLPKPKPSLWYWKFNPLHTLVAAKIPRADVGHAFSASYWNFLIAPVPAMLMGRLFGKRVILEYHHCSYDTKYCI